MKVRIPVQRRRVKEASRVRSYLSALARVVIVVSILGSALALVQEIWHPFDPIVGRADAQLALIDQKLTSNLVAGISVSTVVLILAIAGLSIAARGVRKRQYLVSFWRGILSSAIFLASDTFYRFLRELGRLYYTAALALFIAAILILVEVMARMGNRAEERERRTEYLASIVSGLCFALIVQAGEYLWKFAAGMLF